MSDRKDGNAIWQSDENNVVREVANWQLADRGIVDARNEAAGQWELFQ